MDYLETIPNDMLTKIFFLLPGESIHNLIQTCNYISNICDENFYYNYIKRNFNCLDYGINEWKYDSINEFSTVSYSWKEFLKLLSLGKYVPSIGINILPNDTFITIKQKINNKNILKSYEFYNNRI